MTPEEIEKLMQFIIARQERIAELQEISASQITLLTTVQVDQNARLDEHSERIARFERSYSVIADLLQRHDGQLVALTDGLNSLTRTVERYITAQGNGNGGA